MRPKTCLSTLHILSHLSFTTALWHKHYYCSRSGGHQSERRPLHCRPKLCLNLTNNKQINKSQTKVTKMSSMKLPFAVICWMNEWHNMMIYVIPMFGKLCNICPIHSLNCRKIIPTKTQNSEMSCDNRADLSVSFIKPFPTLLAFQKVAEVCVAVCQWGN